MPVAIGRHLGCIRGDAGGEIELDVRREAGAIVGANGKVDLGLLPIADRSVDDDVYLSVAGLESVARLAEVGGRDVDLAEGGASGG